MYAISLPLLLHTFLCPLKCSSSLSSRNARLVKMGRSNSLLTCCSGISVARSKHRDSTVTFLMAHFSPFRVLIAALCTMLRCVDHAIRVHQITYQTMPYAPCPISFTNSYLSATWNVWLEQLNEWYPMASGSREKKGQNKRKKGGLISWFPRHKL